jgi:hypothetical protein
MVTSYAYRFAGTVLIFVHYAPGLKRGAQSFLMNFSLYALKYVKNVLRNVVSMHRITKVAGHVRKPARNAQKLAPNFITPK